MSLFRAITRAAIFTALLCALGSFPLAAQSTINQYSLGTDIQPLDIAAGPDGNLWYTVNGDGSAGSSKVGRITPAGTITEFVLPDTSRPVGIVAGPDAAMWFAESGAGAVAAIGRIDTSTFPAGGSVTHFSTGIASGANPFGICVGPDNNLWFTERNNNAIAKITTGGAVTEFPTGGSGSVLLGIVAGPDGNLWFTDDGSPNSIWVMTTTGGNVKQISTPTAGGNPAGITVGPDGRIWFVEFSGSKVGVMATSAAITTDITEYSTLTTKPFRIASGPDGALWFTENNGGAGGKIGRITTSGTMTEYTTTGLAGPYGIALGPDRALWFTERDSSPPQIGQLLVDCVVTVPTITGGGTQCAGTTLTLTASAGWTSYQWSLNSVAIGGATSATYTKTAATGDTGSYTVTGTNGSCTSNASVPVSVTVAAVPVATAGGPQTICALGTTAGLGGNTPAVGTGAWSVVSGGTGTFSPNAATPNATFTHVSGAGPITLRWTVSNPPCTDATADVVVTVSQPPTAATAGGPQTICVLGTTAGLGGNTPTVGTGAWSVVSGGTGSFGPNATTPNATFTHATGTGPITLRWTISNAPCASSVANVTITITQPPTAATAGGPQTICALGTTVGLGGNTPTVGTGAWSVVSGGTGSFSPNATTPNATFTHATGTGPITLRWTISNGTCTPSVANVTITISQPPTTATAGGAQTICVLSTTVGLGGNTPIVGTGAWSVVSGGTGTFSPNATTPNATFTHATGAGPITLRWTISNAPCAPSVANVTITITQPPTAATAGGPQTICALGTTAGLGGNAPTVGTGAWSVVSGGTGSFSPNATTPNATFTHATGAGPVVLAWTISNAPCAPSVANVTITITQPPTAATAGGPQTICNLGASQPLGGNAPTVGTGAWSVVSGGTGTFSPNATTPNATFTHTGGAGPIVLAWTISNPPCAASTANVTLTIGPNQTVTINAPASLCASSNATASVTAAGSGTTYTWSVTNGTIVSGQGTPTLVFVAGPSGSVKLDIVQVTSSCTSNGTVTIPIDTTCVGPTAFVSTLPCRRIDTRLAADAPALAAGGQRTFVLTNGPCTIPSTAKAVSLNVTITQAAAAGDLKLFATGAAIPTATAISFGSGQTRANNAIVELSADGTGRVDVKNDATGTVHVIVDVNGYFQ